MCALVLRDGDVPTLKAFVRLGADVNGVQQVRVKRERESERARESMYV